MPRSGDAGSLQERQENLAVRREEDALTHSREQAAYALEKARIRDQDVRRMTWALFVLGVGVFVFSLLGTTAFDWRGASYILTAIVSGVAGNMIRFRLPLFSGPEASPP